MAQVMRMPGVAAGTDEAVLSDWVVAVDATFAAGDVIATVETDKAAVDVEAEGAGVLLSTLVPAGAQVEVGAPIAVLGETGEQVDDLDALLAELGVAVDDAPVLAERRDVPTDPGSGAPVTDEPDESPDLDGPEEAPSEDTAPIPGTNGRIFISPLARKLANDAGLELGEIDGSGPRGRILRRDVDRVVAERSAAPAPAPAATPTPTASAPAPDAAYEEIPHSRMRRAVARRLQESKREAPHFYLRASLRVDRLMSLRAELNDGAAVRISLNDLVVKAAAGALLAVPEMNVVWTADAVRSFPTADLAVAVSTDRGLLTPVVRDVGSLSISAVAQRTAELAGRAREGKLSQDDLEGGTMSVTNLGMYGVEEFAAIINPPHAAILAVGAAREEAVVEHGQLVVGKVLHVTLSVDHRPVDGVIAAHWMGAFRDLIEHPLRILA